MMERKQGRREKGRGGKEKNKGNCEGKGYTATKEKKRK